MTVSFGLRFAAALLVVSMATVAGLLVIGSHKLQADLSRHAEERGEEVGRLLAAAVGPPLVDRDYADLADLLRTTARGRGLDYLVVHDHQGRRVAGVGWPEDRPLPRPDASATAALAAGDKRLDRRRPVTVAGRTYGTLHIGLSLAFLDAAKAELRRDFLVAGGTVALVWTVLFLLVGRLLGRDLKRVEAGARKIAEGDLEARVTVARHDELGHLAQAFNAMADALARQVQDLDSFFTLSLDMLCIAGTDGYFRRLNPAWENILGWTEAELQAEPFIAYIHPDDVEATRARMAQLAAGETVPAFENRYRHKDGSWRRLEWAAIAGPDGRIYALARDVTERRRLEDVTQQERERFFSILDGLPAFVYLQAGDHSVRFANRRFRQLFGEPGTAPCYTLLAGREEPCEPCPTFRVMETGEPLEWEWTSPEGRVYRIFDYPFTDLDGERLVLETGIDISDEKHTLDALMRSNAELERFTFIAAHDLQEPVRGITTYSQLLERELGGDLDPQARQYLDYLVRSAHRMGELVRDLLVYSRVSAHAEAFYPVDLNEAAEAALANLDPLVRETGGTVGLGPLPRVRGNAIQLTELLQNLIGNGLKFHRPGTTPRVTVSGRRDDIEVHLEVADNGMGIEPQYRDRVFGIFQRLHPVDKYPGTGVGLAVCKRIVERHGGRIYLDAGPEGGTRVAVTLPAAEE